MCTARRVPSQIYGRDGPLLPTSPPRVSIGDVDADPTPEWFADVAGWLVTMSEGRFGLCRMLLWLRTADGGEEDASVVMPHPEYTQVQRGFSGGNNERALFSAPWRRGFLPSERPTAPQTWPSSRARAPSPVSFLTGLGCRRDKVEDLGVDQTISSVGRGFSSCLTRCSIVRCRCSIWGTNPSGSLISCNWSR